MEIKGIDVSKWQGAIDWAKVKADGIQFAIIRATCGTTHTDPQLVANVKGCEANGIPYGFYHYSYAKSVAEALQEAAYFLSVISPYKPTYPVFFDAEDASMQSAGKQVITDLIIAFGDKLEKAGYYFAVYANKNWFTNILEYSRLTRFDCWLAQYNTKATWTGNYGIWQHCSDGRVNGINGNVDMDIAYRDYAEYIKSNGLNGYAKVAEPRASLVLTDILNAAEAEDLAMKIANTFGYKNHRIEVQK